jgi:hypothetical protein
VELAVGLRARLGRDRHPPFPARRAPAGGRLSDLKRGARGDLVLWAQEHLIAAGQSVGTDGSFNAATETAVRNFQTARALLVTGQVDAATWDGLLRYQPAAPNWGQAARASRAPHGPNGPRSAVMRARRDELRSVGRGGRARAPAERANSGRGPLRRARKSGM